MREDTTYAAPGKDKTAAESGDAGGVYSYAATTTVVGAKHTKPGAKPSGERNVAENISAHPEKPMRGSKKQPPPANVPHKQGPVGDLYAMPDKKALEVGHKSGPQGDMYAMSVKPSKVSDQLRLLMFSSHYLPSGVSVASEARPIIAFYSRFRDICIYIYMSVCKSIVHT